MTFVIYIIGAVAAKKHPLPNGQKTSFFKIAPGAVLAPGAAALGFYFFALLITVRR